jgi:peptidoglycan/LPS O-acetylase OafA/YrhL
MDQLSPQSSLAQTNNHYMPYLDGLRAVAVFGVLISHFAYNEHWLIENRQWGRLGVDLFFVLSGFLITQILLRYRDNSHNFKDIIIHLQVFYGRRSLRIFPAYFLTILLAVFLGYEPVRNFVVWHLTYSLNIAIFLSSTNQFGAAHHFWSLAIEEQFYLIWPCIILFVPPNKLRYIMFGFILIGVISRMTPIFIHGFSMDPLANTRFDVLGLGALLALYWHQPLVFAKEKLFLLLTGVTSGLPLVILFMTNGFAFHLRPMASVLVEFGVALFFMGIIDKAAHPRPWRIFVPLGWKPVRYIGKISYGIYIYHPFVKLILIYVFGILNIPIPSSSLVQLLLYSSVSILFASVSWHLIEHPINKLKERIKPIEGNQTRPFFSKKDDNRSTETI